MTINGVQGGVLRIFSPGGVRGYNISLSRGGDIV